jgi:hypothetical protein
MRRWFLVSALDGPFLEGPDLQRKVIAADLDELVYTGYLRSDVHGNYTISPEGRAFYAEMQRQTGEPTHRADARSDVTSTARPSDRLILARTISGPRPRTCSGEQTLSAN